jgi:hypothetical protein
MAFVKGDWVAGVNPADGDWRSGRIERVTNNCVYVRMLAADQDGPWEDEDPAGELVVFTNGVDPDGYVLEHSEPM